MTRIRIEHVPEGPADDDRHGDTMRAIHDLRHRVFVEEQSVSEALEWDGLDELAEHFLALRVDDGRSVGTARLRVVEGQAKAERVAVCADERESGIGRVLMAALEVRARARGCTRVALNAQVAVLGFYERLGYEASGPVFEEAGIDHRAMIRVLGDGA